MDLSQRQKKKLSGSKRRKMKMIGFKAGRFSRSPPSSRTKFKPKFSSVFDEDRGRPSLDWEESNDGGRYRGSDRRDVDLRMSLKRRRWSPSVEFETGWEPSPRYRREPNQERNQNHFEVPWEHNHLPHRAANSGAYQNYMEGDGTIYPNGFEGQASGPSSSRWEHFEEPGPSSSRLEHFEDPGPGWSEETDGFPLWEDEAFVPKQENNSREAIESQRENAMNSNAVKMAVVPIQFPTRKLNEQEADHIRNLLLREMLSISGRGEAPQFTNSYFESGIVFVTAANDWAASWLCEKIYLFQQELGFQLLAAPARELLKTTKVSVWIQEPLHREDPNQILHLLKVQNAGLRTEDWSVFRRKMEPKGQFLFLNVDRVSMNALLERKLKAFLGLTQITFQVISKSPYGN